ncbi:MAG TPA: hypothetical protein VMS31_18570, partial [Pyrinomonadaceae bacterium]|nr:hypothetical protein [Pyrinomonadaceae bacterium]
MCCVDTVIVGYNTSTSAITRYPTATFSSISVDAATDSAGNSQIFAILNDGNAYHLAAGPGTQPYSWVQLSQAMTFRQIDVDTDSSGNIQVFAVSGDNNLYHWERQAGSQTGYSFPPASIFQNVARLAVAANDSGDVDLFAIGTAQNTLTHLYQEQQTSNWQTQRVEVPANGQVEEYVSYTSDVTLSDAVGALLVNSPVSVWAAEETKLTINGATYFVDAHRPARTSTNSAGMLSIAQETGSLAIPAIQINLTGIMPPDTSIAIQQSGGVQSDLATVQGTDLMEAKDVNGNYLLADQYRNQATTDSLASAFNKCMSLTGSAPPNSVALPTRRGPKPGIFLRSSGLATDLRLIAAPAVEQHWQLSFNGFDVRYRDLTREEAFALLVEKRASIQSSFGIFDWLDDVGDFLAGVVDGVISVVDTVITTVAQGVQAAFTFIVNGVTYLYETVITFVEQAFAAVEAFFAQVKVFFEKIFEWLGFLFNWPDILRTHVALSYAVNEFLTFLQGSAAGVQTIVDNGLSNFQNQ